MIMKKILILGLIIQLVIQSFSQTISVSSFSGGLTYRQLFQDGRYVKNTTLPNFDIRWRVYFFSEKPWRISLEPGFFSRLYSLHDKMYDVTYTSKRVLCPAISLNIEKHFKNTEKDMFLWGIYAGITPVNLVNEYDWIFNCVNFYRVSWYLQGGSIYHINSKFSAFAQFNYPWKRNMYNVPINVGLGTNNTLGAYLSTPTLGNERWSISAGLVWNVFGKEN